MHDTVRLIGCSRMAVGGLVRAQDDWMPLGLSTTQPPIAFAKFPKKPNFDLKTEMAILREE
jgi:hypothetical protein